MTSLKVNIDGQEYTQKTNFLNIGYEQTIFNSVVYVDDSDLINHFHVECYYSWIYIKRLRNSVEIIFAKNDTCETRVGCITFHHNLDINTYVSFIVNQSPCDYSISVDVDEIQFDTLLDQTDENSEVYAVNVTTTNGSCDFIVPSIVEYAKNENDVDYFPIKYDNGLKLTKLSNSELSITNYGKVSLYYDNYYVINLCHRNNPKSNVQITVRYTQNNNETGFGLADGD